MRNSFGINKNSNALTEIVHDLKTPITSIMGFAELLKKGAHDEKECREFYDIILLESQRLLDMVNDILKADRASINAPTQKCNINIQVNKYVNELKPLASKRNIEIVFHNDDSDIYVSVPENKISRILTNIIENAIKYNKEYGKVYIDVNQDEKNVFIKIQDTGMGIADKDLDHIFKKHYRAESVANIEGSGLGLSIAKDIIEAYGGNISVKSQLGKSTEFVVTLPIANLT